MPELPEAERIRQSLAKRIIGVRVAGVRVRRRDIVRGEAAARALLAGQTIARIERKGKQLALVGDWGSVVRIRLGMTGRLTTTNALPRGEAARHVHIVWRLSPSGAQRVARSASSRNGGAEQAPIFLAFQDARRFGGVHTHADEASLAQAWAELGPDALTITTRNLSRGLAQSRRAIKAALLDQRVLAGVGNIYADEALHSARIAPAKLCWALSQAEIRALAAAIRATLRRAVRAGGSTIRDYVDSDADPGAYQRQHKVYGRGGSPCSGCMGALAQSLVAQRTTVWCPRCQQ